jgi:hypothetical protein
MNRIDQKFVRDHTKSSLYGRSVLSDDHNLWISKSELKFLRSSDFTPIELWLKSEPKLFLPEVWRPLKQTLRCHNLPNLDYHEWSQCEKRKGKMCFSESNKKKWTFKTNEKSDHFQKHSWITLIWKIAEEVELILPYKVRKKKKRLNLWIRYWMRQSFRWWLCCQPCNDSIISINSRRCSENSRSNWNFFHWPWLTKFSCWNLHEQPSMNLFFLDEILSHLNLIFRNCTHSVLR